MGHYINPGEARKHNDREGKINIEDLFANPIVVMNYETGEHITRSKEVLGLTGYYSGNAVRTVVVREF